MRGGMNVKEVGKERMSIFHKSEETKYLTRDS